MAEHSPFSELEQPVFLPLPEEDSDEDNLVYGNFQPDENRLEGLRRIGAITMQIAVLDTIMNGTTRIIEPRYGEILSSEPMWKEEDEKGNIDVLFLQYWEGYRGDNLGIVHKGYVRPEDDGKSLETIRLLHMRWNSRKHTVEAGYVHPRNLRYKFADYRAKMREKGGPEEMQDLRRALWDENGPAE